MGWCCLLIVNGMRGPITEQLVRGMSAPFLEQLDGMFPCSTKTLLGNLNWAERVNFPFSHY